MVDSFAPHDLLHMIYVPQTFEILVTERFADRLGGLKDRQGRARIIAHLVKMAQGNLGDVKPVGSGVSEVRLHFGPGYRLYFLQKGRVVVIMLCGGDKSSQAADIADAVSLAEEWRD